MQLPRPVRRIVVLRANGLGDFLFATPALRALARGFPEAEITYLCRPSLQEFIAGRYPYIHRALAIPYYPKLNDPPPGQAADGRAIESFLERMRAERFDLAIQMQGGGVESNPFVARLGARHTLGLTGRGVRPLQANLRYVFYQNEVLRYLELVGQLGIAWDGLQGLQMDVPLLPADFARLAKVAERRAPTPPVAPLFPSQGPAARPAGEGPGAVPYVVLHPGAGDPRRRWPLERFARVAELVHERFGRAVVVGASRDEQVLAERLRELSRVPLLDVAGQLDVGAYAALLSQADLFVGNDTGPAHVAFALGVPSVVVYWCGNLITAGPPTRELFRPVLSWTVDCPACGRRQCRCQVSFVQDAPLDEVLEHVTDLLEAQVPTGARSASSPIA